MLLPQKNHYWFNCKLQFRTLFIGYQWWRGRLFSKIPTEYHWLCRNDETEDTIYPDKPSPSAVAKIEIDLKSPIAVVSIVTTEAPVFPSAKVPAS